jgi:hypothetical protein
MIEEETMNKPQITPFRQRQTAAETFITSLEDSVRNALRFGTEPEDIAAALEQAALNVRARYTFHPHQPHHDLS